MACLYGIEFVDFCINTCRDLINHVSTGCLKKQKSIDKVVRMS